MFDHFLIRIAGDIQMDLIVCGLFKSAKLPLKNRGIITPVKIGECDESKPC